MVQFPIVFLEISFVFQMFDSGGEDMNKSFQFLFVPSCMGQMKRSMRGHKNLIKNESSEI